MDWSNYHLTQGDEAFRQLWGERGATPTLVIIGGGFDPRTARALEAIADGATAGLDVVRIELGDDTADERAVEIAADTRIEVDAIAAAAGTLTNQPYPETSGRRSAGLSISKTLHESGVLVDHEEIVVDISGLPRSVFFPLVKGLLQLADEGSWSGDLHVAVCDNPSVDAAILTEGAEAPTPIGGFAGVAPESPASTIWVPVLGEGRGEQLLAIWEEVNPDEVIPVLPFPSAAPRRADDLLLEYREFLFDVVDVEPRNFMHANEANPFDLFRSLERLHTRYQEALAEIGGAKFVVSTHSSKLLSVGALMAGHQLGMQVQQVSPTRSGLKADADINEMRHGGVLSDLWMTGEPYA